MDCLAPATFTHTPAAWQGHGAQRHLLTPSPPTPRPRRGGEGRKGPGLPPFSLGATALPGYPWREDAPASIQGGTCDDAPSRTGRVPRLPALAGPAPPRVPARRRARRRRAVAANTPGRRGPGVGLPG